MDDHTCPGDYNPANDEERAAIGAFMLATKTIADRWSGKLIKAVPGTKLIDLPCAGHFVFLARDTEVISGIREFLAGLARSR